MKKYMKKIYIHICSYIYMKKIGKKNIFLNHNKLQSQSWVVPSSSFFFFSLLTSNK